MRLDIKDLFEAAKRAREGSYSPYSGYSVGAALLCDDGTVYTGCNIENASLTPTVCAERVAFFKALSDGKRAFTAIAVAGGKHELEPCAPCGVCRQVMMEFCDPDTFEIVLDLGDGLSIMKLRDLLPCGFGPINMK